MTFALEELNAKLFLKQAHMARDSRLHDAQKLGRPRSTTGVRDGQEGPELLDVHVLGSSKKRYPNW
ncbi:hypothetical protein CBM2599_B50356 [Cupriavidus taiwanensis]|nr:hypothetical protein CBM2600_B10636 [Cupriavidus taiwanensis]SOY96424.1 hypothetical protein CBM2599_B50356 [Cupriavidus taiwanensis]